MNGGYELRAAGCLGQIGCLLLAGMLCLVCLMPVLLVDVMRSALERLSLSPPVALAAVLGIFVGGLFNIPLWKLERDQPQVVERLAVYGLWGLNPQWRAVRNETVIALNVGGGLIPLAIAGWELNRILARGGWPLQALLLVTLANVGVCHALTRPVRGVGLMMPGFASPAVAVLGAWLLLGQPAWGEVRPAAAFVAGVLGPVIGADLLHLKDISKVSAGMLSIGGAGTFDGIVLSGFLAALLA